MKSPARLRWKHVVKEDPQFGDLVVPNGSNAMPFHRWFHMKEAFSPSLLNVVLERTGLDGRPDLRVIDPYVGSGTTVISALTQRQPRGASAVGIERNPFLAFLATTKVSAIRRPPSDFSKQIRQLVKQVRAGRHEPHPTPALSTFSNSAYFSTSSLRLLLELRSGIDAVMGDGVAGDLARVCLAGTVEPSSFLRRDGRALRYQPSKHVRPVLDEFGRRAALVAEDLARVPSNKRGKIIKGDGRRPTEALNARTQEFDLAFFSPPYPNNIDYTEIYKLESWLLGLTKSAGHFRDQRRATVRSHPSVRIAQDMFAEDIGLAADLEALIQPTIDDIPNDHQQHWRVPLIRGYFDDMLRTFHGLFDLLRPGGDLVFVVGNSLHGTKEGSFLVPADVIMTRLAELVGFEAITIAVARRPQRRSVKTEMLRESVVFLRKSEG